MKFKKSLNKKIDKIKYLIDYYTKYNKIFKTFHFYKDLKLKISTESLFFKNYDVMNKIIYSPEILRSKINEEVILDKIVKVDENFRIIKNHEVFSKALLNNEKEVPIEIDFSTKITKGIPISDLSSEEFFLFNEFKKALETIGIAIVWGPAAGHKHEIIDEINKVGAVVDVHDISFESKKDFSKYVKYIYEFDGTEEFINKKIERLVKSELRVIGIAYEVGDLEISSLKGESVKIGCLKDHIRRSFRERVENYIFDVVFHAAFSKEECIHLGKVLSEAETYGGQYN